MAIATADTNGAARKGSSEAHELFPSKFDWPLAYQAEDFVRIAVESFLRKNSFARNLADRMMVQSATDFFEWIDHLVLPSQDNSQLLSVGYVEDSTVKGPDGETVYEFVQATLPRILIPINNAQQVTLALKPEFVAEFAAAHHLTTKIKGGISSRYRTLDVSAEHGTLLQAVERRAYRGFEIGSEDATELAACAKARELWQVRPRHAETDGAGIQLAFQTLDAVLKFVDADLACHLFFEEERAYWQKRNRAAQVQKQRQDQLGLGWGNHDHHTFRCSRAHFADLNRFLVKLGFLKRERYYAGAEAGWGAQILEQPTAGIVVFADVDLLPGETDIDFSVQPLPPASKFGTVGLWVALHGESLLQAGMHHLEARFSFDSLRDQLKERGVNTMKPFSDFKFLRQAFTEGERWPVESARLEKLLASGGITPQQHEAFLKDGAIGSHLENLERHGGYKGFNQKSVSAVISATDPRKHQARSEPAPVSA